MPREPLSRPFLGGEILDAPGLLPGCKIVANSRAPHGPLAKELAYSPRLRGVKQTAAYNARPVRKPRSNPPLQLPAWAAPVVAIGGYALMNAGALLLRGLGMRPFLVGSELLLALPSLLAFALAGIPVPLGLGLRKLDPKATAVCVALGVAFWAASLGLFELQYTVWKPPPGYLEGFERLHDLLKPSGPLDAVASLAAIALAPALCEEVVFRGAALPALLPRLGAWGAVLGSAALFGLIHVDWTGAWPSFYRVPFAFAVGLGLGELRLRTGSLWSAIAAHATLNGITFFAAPLAQPTNGVLPDPEPWLGAGLFAAGSIAAVWLFTHLRSPLTRSERPA